MLPLRGMASKCVQYLSFTTVNGCAVTVYNSDNMNTDCCFNQTTLNQHKGSGRPNTSVLHVGYLLKTNSLRTENNILFIFGFS